jgi:hypothetical protein
MFEKLRKVTRISELDRIIPHKNELDLGNMKLGQMKELILEQIDVHLGNK